MRDTRSTFCGRELCVRRRHA